MKTFLTLLLFPLAVHAQTDALGPDDLRDRAFRMARATVEFLATDAKTYGYPDKTTCPDCVSYPRLKAFIKEQKLTKADELVNETERWAAAPATAAKAPSTALTELRTQLVDRVTAGSERQHRRSLPSFATYESQMNQLAGLRTAGGAPPESIAMNITQQNEAPDATADLQDAEADSTYSEGETVAPLSASQSSDNGWLSKSGLALLLSLLSLLLVGWLLVTRKKGDNPNEGPDAGIDGQIAKLSDDLFRLKGERNTAQDANIKLQNRVAQLETQVAVLQKAVGVASAVLTSAVTPGASTPDNVPKKDGQPTANPAPVQRQQVQSSPPAAANPASAPRPAQNAPSATPPAAENRPRSVNPVAGPNQGPSPTATPANAMPSAGAPAAPRILYGRTVDLGDGFSADSLSETTSERPMVYQIQVVSPTQASFRVADDPYAQRLALSDPYSYLNDACEYTSQPASNSRIQTVKPGRLALQGGKWAIIEKAQISFT